MNSDFVKVKYELKPVLLCDRRQGSSSNENSKFFMFLRGQVW